MKEKELPTPAGAKLAELLAERWSGPQVAFVRECGVKEYAHQKLTHWKKRGVPARVAGKAAALLGCLPEEISAIESDELAEQPKVAQPDLRGGLDLPQLVTAAMDGMSAAQVIQWLAAAERLKAGEDLQAPKQVKWPTEPAEDWRIATAQTEPEFLRILEEEGVTPQGAVRIIQFMDRRKSDHGPPAGRPDLRGANTK